MTYGRRLLVTLLSAALLSACTADDDGVLDQKVDNSLSGAPGPSTGGTLRLLHACCELVPNMLDPTVPPTEEASELLTCCLVRSLYGYPGTPANKGGSRLQPDLAEALPDVSADGLTWTVRMRKGLTYAPPYAETAILAADVERAIMRTLRTPMPDPERLSQVRQWRARIAKLTVIAGAQDFAAGRSDTIAGIERPDPHTLRIRLVEQAGDFAPRLAGSDTAPIPPGADTGHRNDYGRFLVSSGPYMVEGSEATGAGGASAPRKPLPGFRPGVVEARDVGKPLPLGLVLVRNPSWKRSGDPLRPAYVDRIEIRTMHTAEEGARLVDSGAADLFSTAAPAPQIPIAQAQRYRASPQLRHRLHVSRLDFVSVLVLNVAVPPFDDVHVRRAIAWALDRQRLLDLAGGPLIGDVATHLVPDGMLDGLLERYDPFPSPGHRGDPAAARREMAQSRYDRDRDGRCDHPACRRVTAVAFSDGYVPAQAAVVGAGLAQVGIQIDLRTYSRASRKVFSLIGDPTSRTPMAVSVGFEKNSAFPDVAGMLRLFSRPVSPHNAAYSLVGASPQQLARWGYAVRTVPSIAPDMAACQAVLGLAQRDCWARLDARLTETLAVAVPLLFQNDIRVTSARVQHYSFDQSDGLPALDRIALVPGAD